jgi:ribonucleoside-triphosphate reductase
MNADGTPADAEYLEPNEPDKPDCSFTLVTTQQCPNCVTVQSFMNDANIEYDIVDVSMYPEVVKRYSVRSAPTLIVRNGNDYNTYANESNIRAFVTSQG